MIGAEVPQNLSFRKPEAFYRLVERPPALPSLTFCSKEEAGLEGVGTCRDYRRKHRDK
jgi:hypothetical protein